MKRLDLVKYRDYSPKDGPLGALDGTVFYEVLRSRPRIEILPHLAYLTLSSIAGSSIAGSETHKWLKFMASLLHAGVKTLRLSVHRDTLDPLLFGPFLKDIAARAPFIADLEFQTPVSVPVTEFEDCFSAFIAGLSSLERLIVSSCCLTHGMLSSLSNLNHLKSIELHFDYAGSRGRRSAVRQLGPVGNGGFAALRSLTLQGNAKGLEPFFSAGIRLPNLRKLVIDLLDASGAADLQSLFAAIGTSCPLITKLDVVREEDSGLIRDHELSEAVTCETLGPLKRLEKLRRFSFTYPLALQVTNDELVDLIAGLCTITVLELACGRVATLETSLTIDVLRLLALRCPRLKWLSLLIRVDRALDLTTVKQPFLNLANLCLGASYVEDTGLAAQYLSRLLTPHCELHDSSWLTQQAQSRLPAEVGQAFRDAGKKWADVKERLPVLIL